MSGQHDHSAAKRQQIIRGAELVFTEWGYEGASMSRIAAEAGVSKGTLYNYFDSKSILFAVFVEQMACETLNRIFSQIEDEADPSRSLRTLALRIVTMIISPSSLVLYRIVVSEARKFPDLATIFWQAGPHRAIELLTRWIEAQVGAGRLVVADPTFAAEQFIALCQTRIATQRRLQLVTDTTPEEVERVVAGAVALFLKGYGADPLAPEQPKS